MNQETSLKHYGLTERFAALANEFPEWAAARVLTQEKGRYRIIAEQGEKWAEVSGRFHYEAVSPSELPAVGDFVMVDWNEQGNAVIHRVLPRKSCFLRRAVGSARQEQVIAANIDTVFLCMALESRLQSAPPGAVPLNRVGQRCVSHYCSDQVRPVYGA